MCLLNGFILRDVGESNMSSAQKKNAGYHFRLLWSIENSAEKKSNMTTGLLNYPRMIEKNEKNNVTV